MKYRRFPESPRLSCVVAWLALPLALVGSAFLLFPLFARTPCDGRRQSVCPSHLKQLGLACLQYTEDYDGRLPAAAAPLAAGGPDVPWPGRLGPYLRNFEVLVCPTQRRMRGLDDGRRDDHAWPLASDLLPPAMPPRDARFLACGYLMNRELSPGGLGVRLDPLDDSAGLFLLGDGVWLEGDGSPVERQRVARAARHHGGANIAFADGHVKWLAREALAELRYAPKPAAGDSAIGGP